MDTKVNVGYAGKVHISVSTEVDVNLNENDIFNWLSRCNNAETLKYLGQFALNQAKTLENPNDDDFRSRA